MAYTDNPSGVLIAAVVAKWQATGALASIAGPYLDNKPVDKQSSIPYCTFELQDAVDDGWTCVSKLWQTILSFTFHAANPEAANTALNTFLATFGADTLSLSMASGSLRDHRVTGVRLAKDDDPGLGLAGCTIRFRTNHSRT